MQREPVTIVGAVVALVNSVFPVLVLFGVNFSPEQIAGLQLVVSNVAIVVGALIVRAQVYAPDTVGALLADAAKE